MLVNPVSMSFMLSISGSIYGMKRVPSTVATR